MIRSLSLVHVVTICLLLFQAMLAQTGPPEARIVTLSVDPGQAVVLHLRPGYVSSVRVLEDVSSVVLGDPGTFRAEHLEAEPQLVFFKTTSSKFAHTNALITTKSGHEIALSLVSQGKLDRAEPVDYVLTCERPRSLIAPSASSFVIGETKSLARNDPPTTESQPKPASPERELLNAERLQNPHWRGKPLQVAVGQPIERMQEMIVPFAVFNSSRSPVEVLPPQIELAGASRDKHRKAVKAEQVAIRDYWISARQLAPGARADGLVFFERPSFKESTERLLLSVAQADAVDRPVLIPIAFVAPMLEVCHESR
jgi:hypothetical protein